MQAAMQTRRDSIPRALAVGFATTTLMWLCSYAAILQPGSLAGDLIFILTLVILVLGGGFAAALDRGCTDAGRAMRRGIEVGLVSAVINLLLVVQQGSVEIDSSNLVHKNFGRYDSLITYDVLLDSAV